MGVPAKDHVAKTKAARRIGLDGAHEFVDMQVFAAQDAIDVADRDLDLFATAFRDGGNGRVLFVTCHEFLRFRSHCTGKNTTDCGSDKNRKYGRKRR